VKVVAGLGNPGEKYDNTPHNIGFEVVDLKASIAKTVWRGVPVLLVKPRTFMNLSGSAIAPLMRYFRCHSEDLAVVVDDADLPLGRIRIRTRGGTGGHNGLASIIEDLGTGEFARVRLGVGRAVGDGLVGHVLGKFADDRRHQVQATVRTAAEAVLCLLENDIVESMNRYNGWQYEAEVEPE
jgi:peptidyl-tRNA hydrolase, PTH1 family